MSNFQEKLQIWLSRHTPERSSNYCFNFPLVLSTDIGLVRKENQDCVAAICIGQNSIKDNSIFAIAVSDGMGGMRDGSTCAKLAISSFFFSLIKNRDSHIKYKAHSAIKYANEKVFDFAAGNGGATLSAILIDKTKEALIVHVGDSRIYSFGKERKVERHTVDDSMAESVGGIGRELLQFVGMGDSLQAHVIHISTENPLFAITTDGIHSVPEVVLEKILNNSENIKQCSERLSALARWCGGHDNASCAIFDLQRFVKSHMDDLGGEIRIWDAYGDLSFLGESGGDFDLGPSGVEDLKNNPVQKNLIADNNIGSAKKLNKRRMIYPKKVRRESQKEKKRENELGKIQLSIEIGDGGNGGQDP